MGLPDRKVQVGGGGGYLVSSHITETGIYPCGLLRLVMFKRSFYSDLQLFNFADKCGLELKRLRTEKTAELQPVRIFTCCLLANSPG